MLVTRDDLSARRQTKTLDELLLEIEQLSQERASHVSVESDDEEETCLLLHEPGKAIIDTGCGRCVIGALTLEAHQSVMGDQAKEIVWHNDTPSVVFYYGNGTKDRSMGVIDLPCVVGGQDMQIKMHVVPRRSSLFAEQELVEREWCCSEYLFRGAAVDKETNHRSLCLRVQVDILNLTCVHERRILARVGPEP